MTTIQRVAQVFGWVFVIVAVWGFFVSGASMEPDPQAAPRLWGLFPVNVLHNLVHLALGIWGIMAARSFGSARSYARIAGALYLLLAIIGFVAPSGFGLVPLGDNDIWLHIVLAIALLGFGLTASAPGDAGDRAVAGAPRVDTRSSGTTTASSPESTTTRPPAEPGRTTGHDRPVPPETSGSSGAAPGAPPPPPQDDIMDEPPRQSERPASPPPPRGTEGDRGT